MKILSFLPLCACALFACVQMEKPKTETASASDLYHQINAPSMQYDSVFAARLGSDARGMKQYVSATLPLITPLHKRLEKKSVAE